MTAKMYLLNGPIMLAPERRQKLVEHMAADLSETGAYADRGESVRQLHRDGYKVLDIMLLVDDARQVAMQAEVAKIMVAS